MLNNLRWIKMKKKIRGKKDYIKYRFKQEFPFRIPNRDQTSRMLKNVIRHRIKNNVLKIKDENMQTWSRSESESLWFDPLISVRRGRGGGSCSCNISSFCINENMIKIIIRILSDVKFHCVNIYNLIISVWKLINLDFSILLSITCFYNHKKPSWYI